MIDIETEQLRLLTKASADVPGNPHVSTLIRWALRGVKGIKLETVLVGGRRFTGTRYCYAAMGTNLGAWHRVQRQLPVGSRVPVAYDPADPSESVLRPGLTGMHLFMVWFLTPFNVIAVGGTSLTTASNTRGWTETAWDGTGSGCSSVYSKPSWQHDTGCSMRMLNDVSAVADPNTGVAVFGPDSTGASSWIVLGGTSVAAPRPRWRPLQATVMMKNTGYTAAAACECE